MPAATLTSKGQLVVPKSIRDFMGLHPGDRLDFVVLDDGTVLMRPATEDVSLLKGLLRRPGRAPVSVEEMNRVIRQRGARVR
jgi:AbrB family looped-hinge helix DNA binding protein